MANPQENPPEFLLNSNIVWLNLMNKRNVVKTHLVHFIYNFDPGFSFHSSNENRLQCRNYADKTLDYIDKNLRPEQVGNCGFNLDNWGGLLLYKLKMKVFIDDRADFMDQTITVNTAPLFRPIQAGSSF